MLCLIGLRVLLILGVAALYALAGWAFWYAHEQYLDGDVFMAGVFVSLGISVSVQAATA